MTENPLIDRTRARTSDSAAARFSRNDLYGYARRLNDSGFSRANNWHWFVNRRQLANGEHQFFLDRRDAGFDETPPIGRLDESRGPSVSNNSGSNQHDQ